MTPGRTALFDRLAALVDYPHGELSVEVAACAAESRAIAATATAGLVSFAHAIAGTALAELEEHYTETFDLSATCALDVGWHLFGDAHERGAFMASLREDLQQAGVPETGELPDHLTHVLRLMGRESPERAAALAEVVAPALDTLHRELGRRGSPYAHLLAAVAGVVGAIGAERHEEVRQP